MYAPGKTWNMTAWSICKQKCGFSWYPTVATRTRGCCRKIPPRKLEGGVLENCMHFRRGGLIEISALYCDVRVAL